MSGQTQPFFARFLEDGAHVTDPRPPIPFGYSDDEQRGIWDPEDVTNPLFMSPTKYPTNLNDEGQDEAH